MVMTYSHAKGQRSVGSKDREYTTKGLSDRLTDRGDCITLLANVVDNFE